MRPPLGLFNFRDKSYRISNIISDAILAWRGAAAPEIKNKNNRFFRFKLCGRRRLVENLHSQLMFPLGTCHQAIVNLPRNLLLHKVEAVVLQKMLSRLLGPRVRLWHQHLHPMLEGNGPAQTTSVDEPPAYAAQSRSKAAEVSKLQKQVDYSSLG